MKPEDVANLIVTQAVAVAAAAAPRRCRKCGCTDDDCSACVEITGSPCHWVEPGLCSACVPQPAEPAVSDSPLAPLTARQADLVVAIVRHVERTGDLPTFEQLSTAMGCAHRTGVLCHIDALVKKGWLRPALGRTRTLLLTGAVLTFDFTDDAAGRALAELIEQADAREGATP